MKRARDSLIGFLKKFPRAYSGRPMAIAILLGLSLLNLLSEWPHELPRPAFVDTIDRLLPDSFGTPRQLLFDHFQRWFPRTPTSQPVTIVAIDDRTLAAVGQWPWP